MRSIPLLMSSVGVVVLQVRPGALLSLQKRESAAARPSEQGSSGKCCGHRRRAQPLRPTRRAKQAGASAPQSGASVSREAPGPKKKVVIMTHDRRRPRTFEGPSWRNRPESSAVPDNLPLFLKCAGNAWV
ncbi:unnamed protein product [Scytosiphon promiscuus]